MVFADNLLCIWLADHIYVALTGLTNIVTSDTVSVDGFSFMNILADTNRVHNRDNFVIIFPCHSCPAFFRNGHIAFLAKSLEKGVTHGFLAVKYNRSEFRL